MRRQKQLRRQDGEQLEHWLRRRAADPVNGVPVDPRMTLELYDRMTALEARVAGLEALLSQSPTS